MRPFLLAALLILLPARAEATNLSARLTASLHSWERQDDDTTSIAHNTIHQLVSLKVKDFGVRGLSFHAYGRGFVHAENSRSSSRIALYSTYADWQRIAGRLDLRLGRQRISAGVGHGTVDGARAVVSLPHSVKLLAYAGIEAPPDRGTEVRGWDEGHLYGFRASIRRWSTTFSFSFASESRDVSGKTLTDPDGDVLELTSLARRLVGTEVRTTYLKDVDIYGRVDLDAILWRAHRVQFRGRIRPLPGLGLSAGVDHREPRLDANSILSVFSAEPNTEIESSAAYQINKDLRLTGSYSLVLFYGSETHRTRVGMSRGVSTISYYRRSGYGGDFDGLSVGSRLPITSEISLRGSVNYSEYRLSDAQEERYDSLAGVLALDYARIGKFATSLEGQVLRNKTYDYDLRLFAKVTYWIDVNV